LQSSGARLVLPWLLCLSELPCFVAIIAAA